MSAPAVRIAPARDRKWKPYPAYKDSGVEWVGEIPEHWEVKRLKYTAAINTEVLPETTDPAYELEYLDISNVDSTGTILQTQSFRFEDAPSRARRRVRNGDTIISTVRTYLKAISFLKRPPANLIVSTGFAVLRPGAELLPAFLWRLVQSNQFVDSVVSHSEGVGYPAINPSRLACLPCWIPPIDEQRAIASFLDRETARIDALIAKKERLIALMEEKRTTLISRAVTKGLDPNAPMKGSSIEWLGEIPTHWENGLIKRYFQIDLGKMLDSGKQHTEAGEYKPYLRAANIHWDHILLDDVNEMKFSKQQLERYKLQAGDLLVTEGGVTVGRSAIWRGSVDELYYQNSLNRARAKGKVLRDCSNGMEF